MGHELCKVRQGWLYSSFPGISSGLPQNRNATGICQMDRLKGRSPGQSRKSGSEKGNPRSGLWSHPGQASPLPAAGLHLPVRQVRGCRIWSAKVFPVVSSQYKEPVLPSTAGAIRGCAWISGFTAGVRLRCPAARRPLPSPPSCPRPPDRGPHPDDPVPGVEYPFLPAQLVVPPLAQSQVLLQVPGLR